MDLLPSSGKKEGQRKPLPLVGFFWIVFSTNYY